MLLKKKNTQYIRISNGSDKLYCYLILGKRQAGKLEHSIGTKEQKQSEASDVISSNTKYAESLKSLPSSAPGTMELLCSTSDCKSGRRGQYQVP